MIVLAVGLVLAALVLVAGPALRHRLTPTLLHQRIHKTFVVTLRSGETFRGVLHECDAEVLILRNAEALAGATAAGVIVDGELILQRGDVSLIQRP